MGFRRFDQGRIFVVRVKHDSDLIKFLVDIADNNRILAASFIAVGALKNAKLGFYDQEKHKYLEISVSTPQEIVSCLGNVSLKEGKSFVHAHAVLADRNGNTQAGHLLEGKVFAAEVHLTELLGEKLTRKSDEITGLSLWDISQEGV